MSAPKRTVGEPHDNLTELANEVLNTIKGREEGLRAIVILHRDNAAGTGTSAGIGMSGYDEDAEALAEMIIALKLIFQANGKQLIVGSLGGQG